MGTIFSATDPSGAEVAIKLMHGSERRFQREIGILSGIEHPRIVRYIDHGTTESGRSYLVMEKLDGEDLSAHLRRVRPSIAECITLGIHVAEGLEFFHQNGCVHRDIKPSNVFLLDGEMQRAKLLDFGLARALDSMHSLTNTGAVLGTIGYMAPEQARGEATLDHRADIFSLGCVLYEALSGQAPFTGDLAVAILAKILLDDPTPLRDLCSDVSPRLARLVHAMLAKHPEDRPATAAEVMTQLHACATKQTAHGEVSGPAVVSYREQRALCLLLVAARTEHVAAATLDIDVVGATVEHQDDGLERVAASFSATLMPMLDGSALLLFELDGMATDVLARAARCALGIRTQHPDLRQALSMGKAEHSGGSVIGQVIERASQLLQHCSVGELAVDPSAVDGLCGGFDLEMHESHVLIIQERDDLPSHTLLGKPSHFVGRARELAWLTGLFNAALEERCTTVALISGIPGSGKSRLVHEFANSVIRSGHNPLVLVLRCAVAMQESPLAALRAALLREAGVLATDGPEVVRMRVANCFSGADQQLRRFIMQLCGLGERSGAVDEHTSADAQRLAWLEWLRSQAQLRSLLLIVEDLQWCDSMSAKFVRAAANELDDSTLMVIATARPAYLQRFPAPWSLPSVERLEIGPLSNRASEALVRGTVGELDPEQLAFVIARAEGNPFFLEELIRTLHDDDAAGLPDSVLSVVQARLLRLSDDTRRLLRAASVFDATFEPDGVARLLGCSLDEVITNIDALVVDELLVHGDSGTGSYRFRHALVREGAYAMLSELDRAEAHRAAAEYLASIGADRAEIAAQYARGEDRTAAGKWWLMAARRALASADYGSAGQHVERALECGLDTPQLAESRVMQAEIGVWRGEIDTGRTHALEALGLVEPGTEPWFGGLRWSIHCDFVLMRFTEVREHIEQLREFAGSRSGAYVICVAEATYLLCLMGDIAQARVVSDGIEHLIDDAALSARVCAAIHHSQAVMLGQSRQLWAALDRLTRARALHEQTGDLRASTRARGSAAWTLAGWGALPQVEQLVQAGLVKVRRARNSEAGYPLEFVLGYVRGVQGELAEAERQLQTAATHIPSGDRRFVAYTTVVLAQLRSEHDSDGFALDELRLAVEELRPFASQYTWASSVLGVLLARSGHADEALPLARAGFARLREYSLLDDEPGSWARIVEIFELAGSVNEADTANVASLEFFADLYEQVDDASMRVTLAQHRPIVQLCARAQARMLPGFAPLQARVAWVEQSRGT